MVVVPDMTLGIAFECSVPVLMVSACALQLTLYGKYEWTMYQLLSVDSKIIFQLQIVNVHVKMGKTPQMFNVYFYCGFRSIL